MGGWLEVWIGVCCYVDGWEGFVWSFWERLLGEYKKFL